MRLPKVRGPFSVALTLSVLAAMSPATAVVPTVTADLTQIIDTSTFSPPSPDPSGLSFLPGGKLLVSDAEVEETPLYARKNVFRITTGGELLSSFRTTRYTSEPAGLEATRKQLIVCDDKQDRVFFVRRGEDGRYGTKDDKVRSFGTRRFGSRDPEGVALGGGYLFIADDNRATVFRLSPGHNGIFDGVAPGGDDRVRQFDAAAVGQPHPQGIEYRASSGTLFLVSRLQDSPVSETTTRGRLVSTIETSGLGLYWPAGLAWGPSSSDPDVNHLYIADRGVDNATDPEENDGRIFEISF